MGGRFGAGELEWNGARYFVRPAEKPASRIQFLPVAGAQRSMGQVPPTLTNKSHPKTVLTNDSDRVWPISEANSVVRDKTGESGRQTTTIQVATCTQQGARLWPFEALKYGNKWKTPHKHMVWGFGLNRGASSRACGVDLFLWPKPPYLGAT